MAQVQELQDLLLPLFKGLPLEEAMPELVPTCPRTDGWHAEVERIVQNPAIANHPEIVAGLWLYVDDLNRSHEVSQGIQTPIGSVWHGIMHRREGDFWNSKYWFNRAGKPSLLAGLDPATFVDTVERNFRNNPVDLVNDQRKEWKVVFDWCVQNASSKEKGK